MLFNSQFFALFNLNVERNFAGFQWAVCTQEKIKITLNFVIHAYGEWMNEY